MRKITNLPVIGDNVPRRGNAMTRKLVWWGMQLFGWSTSGEVPNYNKFLIVGAPHTSNWDFIIVIATATALGIRLSWMGKHSLFRGPMGPIFRWMGGISVNRNAAGGIVGDTVKSFNQMDGLVLGITPEGTRGKVTVWKSGFYRIALEANVPMLLASFDYGKKDVTLGPLFQPTGDYEADLVRIQEHFKDIKAKHPQLA